MYRCNDRTENIPKFDKMELDNARQNDENENAKDNCANLKSSIPLVRELFHIHRKVGEGAFSSVFLATLKSSNGCKKFALKHLIPTCHPGRIERELKCLQQIGGKDYIVGLELCLRNQGSVVFVMPYMRHDKFSDYVRDMTIEETKAYMRALLSALRRVHKFNIIHRDVKPSNFLYDRTNRRYLLVDFGLAQQYARENLNTMKETDMESTKVQNEKNLKRKKSDENNSNLPSYFGKKDMDKCCCFGKPRVCSVCLTRLQQVAPRAGTPGFRAPEVLLKHPSQTPGKKVIFSNNLPGIDIMSLCQKLKQRKRNIYVNREHGACKKVLPDVEYPKEAYHLLTKLLDLNYKTRITAEQALSHPFLNL